MLLSGQQSSSQNPGFFASGIAWVNAYCQTQRNGGSYSVNKVFTNSGVAVRFSARIVGHELGHNFGASHTHCTNATTGAYPTASNTIDVCFKGEAGAGCYGGAVSCPGGAGTLMSYCNTSAPNGASCGQNQLLVPPDPDHDDVGADRVDTPACLSTLSDVIFADGFD